MSFSRRIAAAFVAAAALLAPLAPAAQAQDRNMVIFGDSVISDPNMGPVSYTHLTLPTILRV